MSTRLFVSASMRNTLTLFCLLFASAVAADPQGRELIMKMSTAKTDLNYSGSFIYLQRGELESMQLTHSSSNGTSRERLISLNGEAREIFRNDSGTVCIWPGSRTVGINKAAHQTPFPVLEPAQLNLLENYYEFEHIGTDRVADRDVEIVDLMPLDNHRYGYQLAIDAETYLMLRSIMRDNEGTVIEEVMYTDINYLDEIPEEQLQPGIPTNGADWTIDENPIASQSNISANIPAIAEVTLPKGFNVLTDTVVNLPGHSEARRVMYTDGLATVSIYITASANNAQNELLGASSIGAVHAYGAMLGKWHATVVGEVPKPTVVLMADSMKLEK